MSRKYDPILLLAEAQELRKKAATADPLMQSVYRSLAAEAEVRATLSLLTPIVKEERDEEKAVPEDGSYSEHQVGKEHDGSAAYENASGKSPEAAVA